MKKRYLVFCLAPMILGGCNNSRGDIELINRVNAKIISYQKDYDGFNNVHNYLNIQSLDEFPKNDDKGFVFFAINYYDFNESSNFFNDLYEKVCFNKSSVIFYNFPDLSVLRDTKFDYKPYNGNYTVGEDCTMVFEYEENYELFRTKSTRSIGPGGKLSFADTVISCAYTNINEYYK